MLHWDRREISRTKLSCNSIGKRQTEREIKGLPGGMGVLYNNR